MPYAIPLAPCTLLLLTLNTFFTILTVKSGTGILSPFNVFIFPRTGKMKNVAMAIRIFCCIRLQFYHKGWPLRLEYL